jgi:hypothetical protein
VTVEDFFPVVESPEISLVQRESIKIYKSKGKLMTDENDENIKINFKSYKILFCNYYGFTFVFFSQIFLIIIMISKFANDYYIGLWAT